MDDHFNPLLKLIPTSKVGFVYTVFQVRTISLLFWLNCFCCIFWDSVLFYTKYHTKLESQILTIFQSGLFSIQYKTQNDTSSGFPFWHPLRWLPQDDYLDACLVTCLQIQESEEDGDVLVFLPGQEDIEALAQLLSENLSTLRAERSRYTHEECCTRRTIHLVEGLYCQWLWIVVCRVKQWTAYTSASEASPIIRLLL